MSETASNTPRLMAAAKEFNIGKDTLIEFLTGKGFSADDLKPTAKLTEQMYRVLQAEFQQDKVAKQKAEQVELIKGSGNTEPKKKKDEEDLSFKKKEAAAPVVETPKPVEAETTTPPPAAPVEEAAQPQAVTNIEAPELEAPKIINKIDLDAIDSSTRPKKAAAKPVEKEAPKKGKKKTEETEEAPAATAPAPVAETAPPAAPEPTEPIIENIRAEKLEGPKILGKIELPVNSDTRPKRDTEDKRKRKRIPIERKNDFPPGQQQGQGQHQGGQQGRGGQPHDPNRNRPHGPGGGGHHGGQQRPAARFGNKPPFQRREDREIDAKEIQDKIKETQAKLTGGSGRGKSLKAKYRKARREELAEQAEGGADENNKLQVTEFISVSELANLMDVSFAEVIGKCMGLGIMVSINQRLEADVIELVASEFGYEVEFIGVDDAAEMEEEDEDDSPENQTPRPPIVTIMGHVDHGKTSLLDYIRQTNVIAGEAGGITQHIGAYEVTLADGRNITFLDTPGHEAFTAMRARGAKVTDIAVIVVAADDAVMPQTKEAISHAQAAEVPMIFALNKIDKDGANPEKIKEQLSTMNILVESWGGKFQSQEISAKKGLHVDLLMEKILLEADLLELKANAHRPASGTIIEASLDKGRGYVATILVQNGTLKQGDMIVSGQFFGKVKAMYNERNARMDEAPPSTPVLILGLNGAPQAGETFKVYHDESEAKEVAYKRGQILREQGMRARKHITLDEIGRRLALGNFKELNVIIKGDVDGSVEALSDSLQKLSTQEIVVKVIHKAVGAITESDVTLATASDAIIIGFNVRPSLQAGRLAENESIQIKLYSIIYNAIEEIKSAMEGMLEPGVEEKILGNVEIREVYKFDKVTVAGCFVLDGKLARNNRIRLVRDGIVIFTGELGSLKRFKDDVKEVTSSMECGLSIRNYNDIKVSDIVEAFEEVEVKRTL
ncbi:translation initiation factor IF-2 [Ferruginibacter albus]|uniref:translation initiation factor IF-2 n=1 Tax=Ferruginibacter albus TaxID=2875540 RepID=UPI001CC63688|nr:translation initiation factor IF-2 [Ferruginibacter albus]UAY52031.1 translation initiation factor IF-2 [Ferruginibacter albus]